VIAAATRPIPRATLLVGGLAAALALRLQISTVAGVQPGLGGVTFASALLLLAAAAGWRPGRLRPSAIGIGVVGAAVLIAFPLVLHASTSTPRLEFPLAALPSWAAIITLVAVAEEVIFRGILFTTIETKWGTATAVALTALSFAFLHVPLYGWTALPLDLAVGVWLGGLRVITGGVTAPATAHVIADLAAWWLV
jgi:membrane protease YdiL (CAAX protease family)